MPAIILLNIQAPKNGYCFVYISNESNVNVFFDNMQVRHDRGRIIEENHYYAFGLKIAAISSKAYGAPNNKHLYQGDFSDFDDDLGWNDFELRSYDPQIGRWIQVDPYDEFASPYMGMGDDQVNNVDPTGGFLGLSAFGGAAISTLGGAILGTAVDIISGGDGTKGMIIGAGVGLLGGIGANLNSGSNVIGSMAASASGVANTALNAIQMVKQFTNNENLQTTSNADQAGGASVLCLPCYYSL